jgi:hypothetical protein
VKPKSLRWLGDASSSLGVGLNRLLWKASVYLTPGLVSLSCFLSDLFSFAGSVFFFSFKLFCLPDVYLTILLCHTYLSCVTGVKEAFDSGVSHFFQRAFGVTG